MRLAFARYNMKVIQHKLRVQRGVVLIVALVFLIALTAVASTLMLNTTADVKMSGATEDRVVASEEAISAMDEVIFRQVNPLAGGANAFQMPIVNFAAADISLLDSLSKTKKNVTQADLGIVSNQYGLEPGCPHMSNASTNGKIDCNILRVQVSKTYGRKNNNVVQVESGVIQLIMGNR